MQVAIIFPLMVVDAFSDLSVSDAKSIMVLDFFKHGSIYSKKPLAYG